MKDGSTHFAHKQEHAVDMDSGAVVAVTLHGGVEGDTSTIEKTLDAADENLKKAREAGDKSKTRASAEEAVGDKGYHSKRVMVDLALVGRRSYISEPMRGRQASCSNAASPTCSRPAACGARTCAFTTTSPNGC